MLGQQAAPLLLAVLVPALLGVLLPLEALLLLLLLARSRQGALEHLLVGGRPLVDRVVVLERPGLGGVGRGRGHRVVGGAPARLTRVVGAPLPPRRGQGRGRGRGPRAGLLSDLLLDRLDLVGREAIAPDRLPESVGAPHVLLPLLLDLLLLALLAMLPLGVSGGRQRRGRRNRGAVAPDRVAGVVLARLRGGFLRGGLLLGGL